MDAPEPAPAPRPLIGRGPELAAAAAALDAPGGRGVLLAGPIGVGKSRLASEIGAQRADAGTAVVRAVATVATSSIPLGALAAVGQLSLRLGDRRDTVVDRVVGELASLADGRPLLLVVDDVDRLDPQSHQVADALAERGVGRVLGTIRTPAEAPTAPWSAPGVVRIEMGDLDDAAVTEVLTSVLGGPVAGETVRRLVAATNGNPLLLNEAVAVARHDGSLQRVDGIWTITEVSGALGQLGDLVDDRLRHLAPDGRDAVELIAVAEVLPRHLAQALVEPRVLAELERTGLVVVEAVLGEMVVRPSHPFYGEAVRAGLGPIARRHHARRLADAAASGEQGSIDVMRVVAWRSDAGGRVEHRLLARAAREARRRSEFDRAEDLAARAVESGGGPPALLLLGEIQNAVGRFAEADVTFSRVVDPLVVEGELPDDEAAASVVALSALALGFNRAWGLGRSRDARDLMLRAADALARSPVGDRDEVVERSVELRADAATSAAFFGDPGRAANEAAALLASPVAPRVTGRAEFAMAAGLLGSGRPAAAVAHSDAGLAALTAVPEGFGKAAFTMNLLLTRIMGLAEAGRIAEAQAAAEETYERSVGVALVTGQAVASWARGRVELIAGRPDEAERWLREARALERELQTRGRRRWALIGLGLAHAARGRWEAAADLLGVIERLDADHPVDDRWLHADEQRLRAALLASRGELTAAERLLVESAARARDDGAIAAAVALWHELVLTSVSRRAATDAATRLVEAEGSVDGALHEARVADAAAVLERCSDRRLDVAQGLADVGARALAVHIARAVSVDALRAGDRAVVRRARTLSGVAGTGGDGLAPDDRLGALSPRQREVVLLAAAGHRNQEIAEHLGITTRTVENHLHRAYLELGVDGRKGLASLRPGPG